MVVAGSLGALSVVSANSWMNQPSGFTLQDGRIMSVDPWAVVFNPATPYEVPHMLLAAYMVTGFVVAGVYAVWLLRGRTDRYHRLGFLVPSRSRRSPRRSRSSSVTPRHAPSRDSSR
jgi:cytochrome d ubiquinol oxidase subunit I